MNPSFGESTQATLEDWLEHPKNRWAFRHVRELIPSARVSAARVQADGGVHPHATVSEVFRGAENLLRSTHTDAIVVRRNGQFIFEWYAPGVEPTDRHIVFSVTKSMTALVVGALAGQGLLRLDEFVATYIPESYAGGFGSATVRHLLDMTAAVKFVEDYDGPDVRRYRKASGLLPTDGDETLHAFLCALPANGVHGKQFRYISPCSDMLGWICERVSGVPFAELVAQHVWIPLSAEHDADLLVDRVGAPRTGGGLCATARDMTVIGQCLVEGGAGVVPEWFLTDLMNAGDPKIWAAGDIAHLFPGGAYRSCWYQPRVDPGVVVAAGIHGQWIYVDVPRRVVVAKQSSSGNSTDSETDPGVIELLRSMARAAGGA